MKNLLPLFIFICTAATGIASPKPIPPIISKILSTKGPVKIFNRANDQWFQIKDLPPEFSLTRSGQQLLKTGEGIFLTVPGTGRVYKAIIANNTIDFVRIDTTYFSGSNFLSLSFNIGNEIYNFGGMGFWNFNGDLRHYHHKAREWQVVELNRYLPWSYGTNMISYFDDNKAKLYLHRIESNPHQTKNKITDTILEKTLFELDIKTGDWRELGLLNSTKDIQVIAQTPLGILDLNKLYDVKNNLIYAHNYKREIMSLFFTSANPMGISITFCEDSTIYFGNAYGRFDSMLISRTRMSPIGALYTPKQPPGFFTAVNTSIVLLVLCCISLLALLLKKQSKKPAIIAIEPASLQVEKDNTKVIVETNSQEQMVNPMVYKSGKLVELLSDQEKNFLSYVYSHSVDERLTSITEINKTLGTSNKSVEIQKRVRGEIINGINQKLSIISKVKRPVIDKSRSDFDKRSFEYFIRKEHFELVNDILNCKKGE